MEGVLAIVAIFIALPWLAFHYITQWKKSGGINREDEDLLDELYDLARRLDERMISIERIMAAENPDWRPAETPRLSSEPRRDEFRDQRDEYRDELRDELRARRGDPTRL